MKLFWTVTGIYFLMALSTATGKEFESSIIDFTIDKITKLSDGGIDTDVNVDATVTPGDNITGISDCTLAILRTDEGSEAEYVTPVLRTDDITETTILSFTVKADAMKDGSVTFIIVAHNQDNIPLASGQAKFNLQEIYAQLDWIGAAAGSTDTKPSLRVKTDIDIVVEQQKCLQGTTYLLEYSPTTNPIDVCLQATNIQDKSLFCDASITVTEFKELEPLTRVALTYAIDGKTISLEVIGTYSEDSTAMEIIFYDPKTLNQTDNFTCTITSDAEQSCMAEYRSVPSVSPFNILLVALKVDGVVAESTLKTSFEDYKTTGQLLSQNLLEVGWITTDDATYDISLDPDVTLPFSKVSEECVEKERCISYFLNLTAASYIVSVKRNDADDLNIVSAIVDMGSSVTLFTIENITKNKDASPDVSITVMVTPDSNVEDINDLTLAILRTDDELPVTPYISHIGEPLSIIDGPTPLDFSVKADALNKGSVTFIIVAHNDQNAGLAAGQAQFNLEVINAQLNWIGAAAGSTDPKPSLRVKTDVNITVDGQECPKGTTYLLEHPPTNDTINVCLAPTNAGDKSLFCDASITVSEFKGIQDLKSVALIYEINRNISIEVNGTYADNPNKLEIVFYDNPTHLIYNDIITCNISSNADKTCKTKAVSAPSVSPFNILFVALDKNEVVTESSSKTRFEDYKTTAEALTVDLMEVSWSVTDFTEYHVFIVPPKGAYSELYVDCDTDPCVVYFMGLESGLPYVVSVQKKDEDLDIVAATVEMSG